MASALRLTVLFLVATAFAVPAAAESRKLLQQVNIPVTVQCLNLLNQDQIANIPGLNVGVGQVIASALGGPGQAPSALFFNSGSNTNNCTNKQTATSNSTCSSAIPVALGVLGQGTLTPCYNTAPTGGRKLLQQVNVPVTIQCLNVLNDDQILNIPGLNVGVIQVILALLGGAGQAPSALFLNTGTNSNNCVNNQTFSSNSTCSSAIPVALGVAGQGTLTPCYNTAPTGGRKLLQQINVPVTAQCVNLLNDDQVLNIPGLSAQVIGVIASIAGAGGQVPSAIFYNTGTNTNNCQNLQNFNSNSTCSSIIPVAAGVAGQGSFIACYNKATPAPGRKLLQQVNVPITIQCLNVLNDDQILNLANLNVGIIQVLAAAAGGGAQTPSAVFLNTGSNSNNCQNSQEFKSYSNCSSAIPIAAGVLGQGTLTPCYNN